jgi:hypothetical protein
VVFLARCREERRRKRYENVSSLQLRGRELEKESEKKENLREN